MEYLTQVFSGPWLFTLAIGMATALMSAGVMLFVRGVFDPFRRRLRAVSPTATVETEAPLQRLLRRVAPLVPYLMPKKEGERSKIRARLLQAGFASESAPATFFSIKIISGLALPAILLIAAAFYPRLTTLQLTYAALIAGFIGLTLPNMVLSWWIERRQREILNGFPDALDLVVACTEAGLGLNAALQRVANDIGVSHPELSAELALVNSEIRAGVERVTALRNLATRTGIEDIRGLVSLLSQSLRFGTGIAETLRIYAHDLRDKRMQRAEEAAAKIGTKMIFPLVFCMFPSFFIVMVGPAVLGVLRVLHSH